MSAIALAHRDNSRSHHVLGKLGFVLAGEYERGPMPELLTSVFRNRRQVSARPSREVLPTGMR